MTLSKLTRVNHFVNTNNINDKPSLIFNRARSYQLKNSRNSDQILRFLTISDNFHRFSNCLPLNIFWGKFPKICPASCTKIFCLEISLIFWKNWWVQNFQILSENFSELGFLLKGLSPGAEIIKFQRQTFFGKLFIIVFIESWPEALFITNSGSKS